MEVSVDGAYRGQEHKPTDLPQFPGKPALSHNVVLSTLRALQ